MPIRQQWTSSGRLDPKSPYVGNFHRGHACTVVEQDDEAVDHQTRRSAMSRSSSESNVHSMVSSADIQELANMELSPEYRNMKPTNNCESLPTDSSKSESIQRLSSSERVPSETPINSRLNLDGIPSTPELCALQAILPKQVTKRLHPRTLLDLHI